MRFISDSIHGLLDYAVAIILIVVPFAADFAATSAMAHWLSVAAGVALLVYSLLTDYARGVRALIPFKVQLVIDAVVGLALIAAPFVFSFGGFAEQFYLVMGVAVVLVVLLTNPETAAATPAASAEPPAAPPSTPEPPASPPPPSTPPGTPTGTPPAGGGL